MLRSPSLIVLFVLMSPAACGTPAATAPAPVSPSVPATSVRSASPASVVSPAAATPWRTEPVEVRREPAVPPVPVLTGIRYAAHPGYHRIVFDISGPATGYSARYVNEVRSDPSDRVLTVPGRAYLLVVLTPAQAHRDDGGPTVSGTHRADLPMLRSYAVAGDFEGHVTIALGLDDVVGYRVGEAPGRIYVDVAA